MISPPTHEASDRLRPTRPISFTKICKKAIGVRLLALFIVVTKLIMLNKTVVTTIASINKRRCPSLTYIVCTRPLGRSSLPNGSSNKRSTNILHNHEYYLLLAPFFLFPLYGYFGLSIDGPDPHRSDPNWIFIQTCAPTATIVLPCVYLLSRN